MDATLHLIAKHFIARMAAASLPPYTWLSVIECSCFAARCGRILQGRSATPRPMGLCY